MRTVAYNLSYHKRYEKITRAANSTDNRIYRTMQKKLERRH
jgi:hypothetical protein